MVSVHLEKTFYPIAEDTIRGLEVCVNVSTEDDPHTVEFPFKVSLSTVDGTASKHFDLCLSIFISNNNQKAALAKLPLTTYPHEWAEPHTFHLHH